MLRDSIDALPKPDPDAAGHSARVAERIRADIEAAGGSIPFSRFMELALYAPGLGYYSAGTEKFGPAGDFITAPEVSPLFGRCLARQVAQILRALGGGDVLELGSGSGALAADLLMELGALDSLPRQYQILEVSAELKERQRGTLARRASGHAARVKWLERLPSDGFRGVVLGNEVLDAMPVKRFCIAPRGPVPVNVAWVGGHFELREGPQDAALISAVDVLQRELQITFPLGYQSEFNPHVKGWIGAIAESLTAGAVLLIDYGYPRREYYHPERVSGTLICHYRHRVHFDPLILPGLQDISASVDFTAVADAAVNADLEVAGFTRQSYFLFGCGLASLAECADSDDAMHRFEVARQVKLLTLPGTMGDRFKAIALTRDLNVSLCGFALQDDRHQL
jgi:SAM-dependent MidA family methyltransferase